MASFGRCQCERCLPATTRESRLRLLIRAPFDSRGPKRFPRESKGARMRRAVELGARRKSHSSDRGYQDYGSLLQPNDRTNRARTATNCLRSRRTTLGRHYCTAPKGTKEGVLEREVSAMTSNGVCPVCPLFPSFPSVPNLRTHAAKNRIVCSPVPSAVAP